MKHKGDDGTLGANALNKTRKTKAAAESASWQIVPYFFPLPRDTINRR